MTAVIDYAWAALAVGDLDASVDWYRRVFCLDVLMTNADTCAVGDADRFVYLVDAGTLFVVGLHQRAGAREGLDRDQVGLAGLAINVGARQLRPWLAQLEELDIAYRGPTPWASGTVAYLEDPDGIPLLLFEPALPTG